jgi:hypothetical protein
MCYKSVGHRQMSDTVTCIIIDVSVLHIHILLILLLYCQMNCFLVKTRNEINSILLLSKKKISILLPSSKCQYVESEILGSVHIVATFQTKRKQVSHAVPGSNNRGKFCTYYYSWSHLTRIRSSRSNICIIHTLTYEYVYSIVGVSYY